MTRTTLNLPIVAALAALLTASPMLAQGKGNGRGNDRQRSEEVRRDRDGRRDRDDRRWDGRRADDRVFSRRSDRRVPPGWCRGVGNPHRTAANCGYDTDRIWRDRNGTWRDRYGNVIRRDGVYRDRSGVLRDRHGNVIRTTSRTSGSYQARHTEFHRQHRARCEARTRNASILDIPRIQRQCEAEHDAWHRREGVRH